MDFRISANLCLCASVTVARLYGRISSVPKPGIHMFQFLSKIQYTCDFNIMITHNILIVVYHNIMVLYNLFCLFDINILPNKHQ